MHHGDVSPDIAAGLLALRKRIEAAKIPPSKLDESINVAIWNIREFGKKRRTDAAIHYIAEVLGQFDLIALVDRRAVSFNGLAAEIDAPRTKKREEYLAGQSFWRAPYMCSFRAGNFDFIAIATHARWGKSIEGRQNELQMLAEWIGD